MKAHVSIFPSGNIIASLDQGGKIFQSKNEKELLLELSMEGVKDVISEYYWDQKIFETNKETSIEHKTKDGGHLFTDRGDQVTFDRVRVSDEEIELALIHAQKKFGQQLTITGDNQAFSERMARIADDMGIEILNPEMKAVIENHRAAVKKIGSR
jgi:hypothetical protein